MNKPAALLAPVAHLNCILDIPDDVLSIVLTEVCIWNQNLVVARTCRKFAELTRLDPSLRRVAAFVRDPVGYCQSLSVKANTDILRKLLSFDIRWGSCPHPVPAIYPPTFSPDEREFVFEGSIAAYHLTCVYRTRLCMRRGRHAWALAFSAVSLDAMRRTLRFAGIAQSGARCLGAFWKARAGVALHWHDARQELYVRPQVYFVTGRFSKHTQSEVMLDPPDGPCQLVLGFVYDADANLLEFWVRDFMGEAHYLGEFVLEDIGASYHPCVHVFSRGPRLHGRTIRFPFVTERSHAEARGCAVSTVVYH